MKKRMDNPIYQVDELGDNPLYGLRERMEQDQIDYCNSMIQKGITFSDSPSGGGKTTLAVAIGKLLYEYKVCPNGLLYLFNPVQENEMGHRPGDQSLKNLAYLDPLFDAMAEVGEQASYSIEGVKLPKWIEAKPHTFLRGTNLEGKFIIFDEAQNATKLQLKKVISRVHASPRTRIAVIGHTGQIDLKNPKDSGFADCIRHFMEYEPERTGNVSLTKKNFRGWISETVDKW